MKKSLIKEKQPIALRAKDLLGGRKSLYLDYYVSADKNHAHKYEFLKLYLLPESSKENREQNKVTLQSAKAIQAQRLIEYANGKANIKTAKKAKFSLVDYMHYFAERKAKYGQSASRAETIGKVIKYVEAFKGSVLLADVDKAFCLDFIKYLSTAKSLRSTKNPTNISKNTAKMYYSVLVAVLNQAVREELIESNPTNKVNSEERKAIASAGSTRTYLSLDELQRLIDANCADDNVKQCFLFACYTGLRYSDIVTLQWDDIKTENNQMFISKQMIKTRQEVIVPIGKSAKKYLPKKNNNKYVFNLPTLPVISKVLKTWAKVAKVDKNVHFHISRHTFATSLLTKGADLYSVSKLLGHTNIATTQVYAEIVNQKKVDAINLLDE